MTKQDAKAAGGNGAKHGAGHDAEHDDYDFTPVRGLPGKLPEGEKILWQGGPVWTSMFRRIFKGRSIAIYFAVLILARVISVLAGGGTIEAAGKSMMILVPLSLVGLGLIALIAWLTARASWYTVTNKRVVMRMGVVLEITFNFPYSVIKSAGLRLYPEGTGDIPLVFSDGNSIAYLHLWPHARPWHYRYTQPMLRTIAEPARVAEILSRALAEATGGTALPVDAEPELHPAPSRGIVGAGGMAAPGH